MQFTSILSLAFLVLACAAPSTAATLPVGTMLEARLQTPVSSRETRSGAAIEAVLIAPCQFDHRIILPAGAVLRGSAEDVRRVGLGLRRGRASLRLHFDTVQLADGSTLKLDAELAELDNAREKVAAGDRVVGIRANSIFGHRMAGIARNVFVWDPLLQTVIAAATTVTLRFPESEIALRPGTEFRLRLRAPLEVSEDWQGPLPRVAEEEQAHQRLLTVTRAVTWQTMDAEARRPADYVNLLLLGEEEWIARAFDAAGWVEADPLTKATGWRTFRAVAEAFPYPEAPMSALTLDERPPELELSKTLNTYSKRHHARLFRQNERIQGLPVYAVSSTQDVAIDFSLRRLHLTHLVDRDIDHERAKVVNDLIATGCVAAAELVDRAWVPHETRNTAGQRIRTDGAVAVLELTPCRIAPPAREVSDAWTPMKIPWRIRVPRQIILTVRNDFTANNPLWQAGLGVRYLLRKAFGRSPVPPPAPREALIASPRDEVILPTR